MPVNDAAECVQKVKDRNMGYLFENMEKMDIQEERRQRKAAEKRAKIAEQKAEMAEQKAEMAVQKAEMAIQKAEILMQETEMAVQKAKETFKDEINEKIIESSVQLCQYLHMEKEDTIALLIEKNNLSQADAVVKVELYWRNS